MINQKEKPKILGIFCHPDDEILWGWPIFQSDKYEKYLIICCSDAERNRPGRKRALQEVCKQENINLTYCLDEPNDFYTLQTRRADYLLTDVINNIEAWLGKAITNVDPDFIFTHNPVGEYGHGSHRLLFEIVSQHYKTDKILITDICQKSNHRSSNIIPNVIKGAYYKNEQSKHTLDMNFYNRCKAIYDKYNAWTWCYSPITFCHTWLLETK